MSSSFSTEALSQIQARQQDLVRLEASITHLQQLFSDVAALLDSQVSCQRITIVEQISGHLLNLKWDLKPLDG